MADWDNETRENLKSKRELIKQGLRNISGDENWYEQYERWRADLDNKFDAILYVKDSFNRNSAGDCFKYDYSNSDQMLDLDIVCLSLFLSIKIREKERSVVNSVSQEIRKENKIELIEDYFKLVQKIVDSNELMLCVIPLHDFAENQAVLHAKKLYDIYVWMFSLRYILRKSTIESIYLLFTYWRIKQDNKSLKQLINSIIDFIKTYFEEFDKDPDMELNKSLDGLMSIKKLEIIQHWLMIINYHIRNIMDRYQELDWLSPTDKLADEIIITDQISRFEMLIYKQLLPEDSDEVVYQKAKCNHNYALWIKTADVIYIVCELAKIISNLSDEELTKKGSSKRRAMIRYNSMVELRDDFCGRVFSHRTFYQDKRKYFDSHIMDILENDAEYFGKSIDDVIEITEALSSDNIEDLVTAKQKYTARLSGYITKEQEEKLDDLTERIVNKIKENIQKLDVYDMLYAAVSKEFRPFASDLILYPRLMSTLVSAEYLYKEYIDNRGPNAKFDYSCVSIMYYMSLEDFANTLVYTPYSNDILVGKDKNAWKSYVTHGSSFFDKRNNKYKTSIELGNLGFLLEGIDRIAPFKEYIQSNYPKTDIAKLINLGQKLRSVAHRRNNAAHGGNIITYQEAKSDKMTVFDRSNEYKGLIIELLSVLFDN